MKVQLAKILAGALLASSMCSGSADAQQTTEYTYDAQGRLVVVTRDDSNDATYEYDDAGNIDSITVEQPSVNHDPECTGGGINTTFASITVVIIPDRCTDPDTGDVLTITDVTQPTNGATATINGNNIQVSNLPAGQSTFVPFSISDNHGGGTSSGLFITRTLGGGGGNF